MDIREDMERENSGRLREAATFWIASVEEALPEELCELLWRTLEEFQGKEFYTAKNLSFSYEIRGNEMFVSRKDKSITRATVTLAFHRALELRRNGLPITGPKKLGTFGASYLYPLFIELGIVVDISDKV